MLVIDRIVQYLTDIEDFFYEVYLETSSWVYPFYYIADPFYYASRAFRSLATYFEDFGFWVDYIAAKILDVLSWSTIQNYILNWLPDLQDTIDWWGSWWHWVQEEIDDWWAVVWSAVQSWVNRQIDDVKDLIDSTETWLANLQADFDNFVASLPDLSEIGAWFTNWWSNILANIIAWGALTGMQIDTLINSWFLNFAPFWEGWLDWKDQVAEFFTDPLQWLYDRMDEWFERFW